MTLCPDLRRRFVPFLDREVSDTEAAAIAAHLEECAGCREVRDSYVGVRQLLAAAPAPAPDPAAWRRLRSRMRRGRPVWLRPVPLAAAGSLAAALLIFATLSTGGTSPPSGHSGAAAPSSQGTPAVPSRGGGEGGDGGPVCPAVRRDLSGGAEAGAPFSDGPVGSSVAPSPGDATVVSRDRGGILDEPAAGAGAVESGAASAPAPAAVEKPGAVPPVVGGGANAAPSKGAGAAASTPAGPLGPRGPMGAAWVAARLNSDRRHEGIALRSFGEEPREFDPFTGRLPLPRGEGGVPLRELPNGNLLVDANGDGGPWVEVPDRGAQTIAVQVRHEDGPPRTLHVRLEKERGAGGGGGRGGRAESRWTLRNVTARTGRWQRESVLLLDGDHDGRYDDPGADALVFSDGVPIPLGSTVACKAGLLDVSVDPAGESLRMKTHEGAMGAVRVHALYQGDAQIQSLVLRSGDRYVEVCGGGGAGGRGPRTLTVPVGTWELAGGWVSGTDFRARVRPGSYPPIVVAAVPEPREMLLGGSCRLEARWERGEPGSITIAADSVAIVGASGEVYEDRSGGLQAVRASIRRKGDGKVINKQTVSRFT